MTMEVVGCHIDCILPWLYNSNEKYDDEPTSVYVCVNTKDVVVVSFSELVSPSSQ